jgi:hypothetical protein
MDFDENGSVMLLKVTSDFYFPSFYIGDINVVDSQTCKVGATQAPFNVGF